MDQWEDCSKSRCKSFKVQIENNKVQATYINMYDDSIRNLRKTASVVFDGEWKFEDDVLIEFQCHEGRGHIDWSNEWCK